MKLIIAILLNCLLSVQCFAGGVIMLGGGKAAAVAGGETCTGDASSGANESFEKGAGQFCTTDWTEADSGSYINTYSSTQKHCGSTALAITSDADTSGEQRAYIDLGSADADFYLSFYIYLPTVTTNYAQINPLAVASVNDLSAAPGFYMTWEHIDSTHQLRIRGPANPAEHFPLTPAAWYRVEIHALRYASLSTMRIYDSTNTAVLTNNGGADYVFTAADEYDDNLRYIVFSDDSTDSTAATFYIDDVRVSLSGADYIGAKTCD